MREVRSWGTQKAVLERRAPPTFDVLIELQDRQCLAVHWQRGGGSGCRCGGRMPALTSAADEAGVAGEAQVPPGAASGNGDRGLVTGKAAFEAWEIGDGRLGAHWPGWCCWPCLRRP